MRDRVWQYLLSWDYARGKDWSAAPDWVTHLAWKVVTLTPSGEVLPEPATRALADQLLVDRGELVANRKVLAAAVKSIRRSRKLALAAKRGGIAYWNRNQQRTMRRRKRH